MLLYPFLGRDFFPEVDAGQMRLHLRGPSGTRMEQTAILVDQVEAASARSFRRSELAAWSTTSACPCPSINLSYSTSGTVGRAMPTC